MTPDNFMRVQLANAKLKLESRGAPSEDMDAVQDAVAQADIALVFFPSKLVDEKWDFDFLKGEEALMNVRGPQNFRTFAVLATSLDELKLIYQALGIEKPLAH